MKEGPDIDLDRYTVVSKDIWQDEITVMDRNTGELITWVKVRVYTGWFGPDVRIWRRADVIEKQERSYD